MGSVSKYCLSRSPVPIIVVRPERKVRKAQAKRRADPKRGKHFDEWVHLPPVAVTLSLCSAEFHQQVDKDKEPPGDFVIIGFFVIFSGCMDVCFCFALLHLWSSMCGGTIA